MRKHTWKVSDYTHIVADSHTLSRALICSLERRYSLAFILIQSGASHGPVAKLNLAMGSLLPGQSVFHPVLVITFGVIFTSMGAAGFFTIGR